MKGRYMKYIEENLFENIDDVYNIINVAAKDIKDQFDIDATDDPEILMTIFSVTFKEFIKALESKVNAGYSRYKIIIANSLELGYDNAENSEYEKNGGFMIYMKYLYNQTKRITNEIGYDDTSIQLCVEWNTDNIVNDISTITSVATAATKELDKLDIKLDSDVMILPIFCTIYESMITYLKIRRAEKAEFEFGINFLSLFDADAQESDDDEDIIRFTPSIENKLSIKSDAKASSHHD